MAAVRSFTLPHYEVYPVQVALFKDVRNADFLRSQLLAGNAEFDYAFLDAAMVSGSLISPSTSTVLRTHVSSHDLSIVFAYLLKPYTSPSCHVFRFLPHSRVVFILLLVLFSLGLC